MGGIKRCGYWDIETGAELRLFEGHGGLIKAVAVMADECRALSGSEDKTLRLWDLKTGAELRRFEGHTGWIRSIAVLADGRHALSGSDDRTLRLWEVETGAELDRFVGDDVITAITISPAGCQAVVGDKRGRVMAFSLPP